MELNSSSNGTLLDDQWSYNSPIPKTKKSHGGAKAKIRNGFGKTKKAASNYMKKLLVREGNYLTHEGLSWIKDKCQKDNRKHKKEPLKWDVY